MNPLQAKWAVPVLPTTFLGVPAPVNKLVQLRGNFINLTMVSLAPFAPFADVSDLHLRLRRGSNISLSTAMSNPYAISPSSIFFGSPNHSIAMVPLMALYFDSFQGIRPVSFNKHFFWSASLYIFWRCSLILTLMAYHPKECAMMCRWSTFCVIPPY